MLAGGAALALLAVRLLAAAGVGDEATSVDNDVTPAGNVSLHLPEGTILQKPDWLLDLSKTSLTSQRASLRVPSPAEMIQLRKTKQCPRLSVGMAEAADEPPMSDFVPCFEWSREFERYLYSPVENDAEALDDHGADDKDGRSDVNAPPTCTAPGPGVDKLEVNHELFTGRHLEDIVALEVFFGGLLNGTMVEVGANDGVIFSSSSVFEHALNWRTVLIEGDPVLARSAVTYRPDAAVVNAVVCHDFGLVHFSPMGTQGGIVELLPLPIAQYFHPHIFNDPSPKALLPARYIPPNETPLTISPTKVRDENVPIVECLPLDFILAELGVKFVDFMVVDIVGAEFAVLSGFDFHTVPVRVVAVNLADDREQPKRKSALIKYMKRFDYAVFHPELSGAHAGWLLLPPSRRPKNYNPQDDRLNALTWFVKPSLLL